MTQQMSIDHDEDVRARVDALLAQMTPAEKAGQLTQYFYLGCRRDQAVLTARRAARMVEAATGAAAASGRCCSSPTRPRSTGCSASRSRATGIGIPLLFGFDVIHGLRTILPVPIAMAASWDPETIERRPGGGRPRGPRRRHPLDLRADGRHRPRPALGSDHRRRGRGPVPRRGRGRRPGPWLPGRARLGTPERVIAGPKHFAGYGAALGGRDYDEVNLSDSELWNVYFPPFQAAVEAGAGNVMTAYMDLNGIPATGNRWLFTEVLRETWGFEGFVVSDANAVRNLVTHGFAADLTDAGARAVNAGVDMEMAIIDPAYDHLPEALESGAVERADDRRRVRRILDGEGPARACSTHPYVDEDRARQVLADPAHREVARIAAERSAVLLRNEGDLLPLDANALSSVAVIGPLADSQRDTLGPWVFDFDLDETVTVLDGIRARRRRRRPGRATPPGCRRRPARSPPCSTCSAATPPTTRRSSTRTPSSRPAVDLAPRSDVAVVVVGEWQNMIGEMASRSSLELPGRQLELLQAVVATGTPVVLLVMNGRPLDLRWAAEQRARRSWTSGTREPRAGTPWRTCCSVTSPPAASCPSPGRGPSARCR